MQATVPNVVPSRVTRVSLQLGKAEIHDDGVALGGDDDVCSLNVAVNDAAGVCLLQPSTDLHRIAAGVVRRKPIRKVAFGRGCRQ